VAAAKANWPETLRRFKEVGKDTPRRNLFLVQCENVLGDHVKNSKNCAYCFDCQELEDCKYMTNSPAKCEHCQDIEGAGYLAVLSMRRYVDTIICSPNTMDHWLKPNLLFRSMASSNAFGCVGVRKGEFVILNKQYTKENLKNGSSNRRAHAKTGEWGDSFLAPFTRFAYNETWPSTTCWTVKVPSAWGIRGG
jgi:hypothetical protein